MMHMMFYREGKSVYLCGFEKLPEDHTHVHISWASAQLLATSPIVCVMCYTVWTNTVDSLERRVRDDF